MTLIEYADLKCPVCRSFSLGAFPALVQRYVRAGKLRVELRLQTFVGNQNDDSVHAAQFALAAAQQNRLWPFVDLFYSHQQDETTTYVTDGFLRRLGRAVSDLVASRALSARSSPAVQGELASARQAFTNNGFTGTPSFQLGRTGGRLAPFTPSSYGDPTAFTPTIDGLLHR